MEKGVDYCLFPKVYIKGQQISTDSKHTFFTYLVSGWEWIQKRTSFPTHWQDFCLSGMLQKRFRLVGSVKCFFLRCFTTQWCEIHCLLQLIFFCINWEVMVKYFWWIACCPQYILNFRTKIVLLTLLPCLEVNLRYTT